ncbi:methyltransferase [Deltaproteobacteria bacterium]|nr:methyltransferase [Deltaproteobacteria bacterium]
MAVFADYARYYNLLYQDKDYAGEAAFVLDVFQRYGCVPETLLDLGCGTGRHALACAQRGVAVAGVDMSETMLALGREALSRVDAGVFPSPLPELHNGDARNVRLGKQFDAVTSLFHVMSYQNSERDALALLTTAREHLRQGGLFFFDFWHGPGVLADPPASREKTLEDATTRVHRLAVPEHREGEHVIVVNYTVTIHDKAGGEDSSLHESHFMRYWFLPELCELACRAGFTVAAEGGWMHDAPASVTDWNAWMLLKA